MHHLIHSNRVYHPNPTRFLHRVCGKFTCLEWYLKVGTKISWPWQCACDDPFVNGESYINLPTNLFVLMLPSLLPAVIFQGYGAPTHLIMAQCDSCSLRNYPVLRLEEGAYNLAIQYHSSWLFCEDMFKTKHTRAHALI